MFPAFPGVAPRGGAGRLRGSADPGLCYATALRWWLARRGSKRQRCISKTGGPNTDGPMVPGGYPGVAPAAYAARLTPGFVMPPRCGGGWLDAVRNANGVSQKPGDLTPMSHGTRRLSRGGAGRVTRLG